MAHIWKDLVENVDYRIPTSQDLIYKDESIFTFDSPECNDGIFICLKEFISIDKEHLSLYNLMKGQRLFLNYRIEKIVKFSGNASDTKRTRVAIGVEGGFQRPEDLYEIKETFTLVCFTPERIDVSLPCDAMPAPLKTCIETIQKADSAIMAMQKANSAQWTGEALIISKYAENLKQQEISHKIPPRGWKCEMCDLRENLWLNLTDGSILCGRKHWDGTGGNNHALEHFSKTRHPLAVKLGTISAKGGDVYSYAEEDMVLDPFLSQHLAHFGIDVMNLEKTDKSVAELEVEMNERTGEWLAMQESDHKLKPVFGAGYTGMRNLGNSCYLNSTLQVIFTIPDFIGCYSQSAQNIFQDELLLSSPIQKSFAVQMAKLGKALMSADYSLPSLSTEELERLPVGSKIPLLSGIRPQLFKLVVGENHPEFSTNSQQDVQEYILHLCNVVEKDIKRRKSPIDPLQAIRFQIGERLQCGLSKKIRLTKRSELILSLPIPIENHSLAEGEKRPQVPIMSCFQEFAKNEMIDDFLCPVSTPPGEKTFAIKRSGLLTFPDYLCVQVSRFTIGADWIPKKLDVEITFPLNGDAELDLSELLSVSELQAGEEAMPDEPTSSEANTSAVQIDESIVEQLINMGFSRNACRRAVFFTNNSGAESAINWIMEHMGDPDFEEPLVEKSNTSSVSSEGVSMLMEMGFTLFQATESLKKTDNNLERAADYAFSHVDELSAMESNQQTQDTPGVVNKESKFRSGQPRYRLFAMISHMGRSTHSGHYVCHIRREGRWVIYNDEKVAESEAPPIGLAYVYWFRRVDVPDQLNSI